MEEASPSLYARIGPLAAKIAASLPLFGVLWWYADMLRLATGWLHPRDFDNWDNLLFPVQDATTPFTNHPAFWWQIGVAYLCSTIWMISEFKQKRVSIYWIIPAIATLAIIFLIFCTVALQSEHFTLTCVLLLIATLYAQPLAVLISTSKNRQRAFVLSAVAMALVLSFFPLIFSYGHGIDHIAPMNRLLRYGMSPDAQDASGETILHKVLFWDDAEAVTTLMLRHGANPNIRNRKGQTPLHILNSYPSSGSTERIRKQLISAGADQNIRDNQGKSAR